MTTTTISPQQLYERLLYAEDLQMAGRIIDNYADLIDGDFVHSLFRQVYDLCEGMNITSLNHHLQLGAALLLFTGDDEVKALVSLHLARIYERRKIFDEAARFNEKAAGYFWETEGQAEMSAWCWHLAGDLYRVRLGRLEQAVECYTHSLECSRAHGPREVEAGSLLELGSIFRLRGNLSRAMKCYTRAKSIFSEMNYLRGLSTALLNAGNIYNTWMEYSQAGQCYLEAARIATLGSITDVGARTWSNMGTMLVQSGHETEAKVFFQEAARLYREIDDKHGEADALGNLSVACRHLGQLEESYEFAQQALEIHRNQSNQAGEIAGLVVLGIVYESLSNPQDAEQCYREAVHLLENTGILESARWAYSRWATVLERRGELDLAFEKVRRCIEIIEDIRISVQEERYRISFMMGKAEVYEQAVLLCTKSRRNNDALLFAEKGKSRAFLELLNSANISGDSIAPLTSKEVKACLQNV